MFILLIIVLAEAPAFYLAGNWVYHSLPQIKPVLRKSLITGLTAGLIVSVFIPIYMLIGRWTGNSAVIPTFIYMNMHLLLFAPILLGIIGFLIFWSLSTIKQAFENITNRWQKGPSLISFICSLLLLTLISIIFYFWFLNYKLLSHYEHNAFLSTSTNQNQLITAFNAISPSQDPRLLNGLSALAENPNSSPNLLNQVFSRAQTIGGRLRENIIFNLSSNPQSPPEILRQVSQSKSMPNMSTQTFATTPNTAPENKATASNCELRRQIIFNPMTTPDTLKKIIKLDPDIGVQEDAQQQLNYLEHISPAPIKTFVKLNANEVKVYKQLTDQIPNSQDSSELGQIYSQVAQHPNFYPLLEAMANNCYITTELAANIYTQSKNLKDSYYRSSTLTALAINPKTPPDVLNQLASEKDLNLLRYVVANPSASQETLTRFLNFPDCKLRKNIILNNPNVPDAILNQLKNDPDETVSTEASNRLSQPIDYKINAWKSVTNSMPSCAGLYSPQIEQMYKSYH